MFEAHKQSVHLFEMLNEHTSIPTNLYPQRGFSVTYPFGKRVMPEKSANADAQEEAGYDIKVLYVS